jgi:hypothetical protein
MQNGKRIVYRTRFSESQELYIQYDEGARSTIGETLLHVRYYHVSGAMIE